MERMPYWARLGTSLSQMVHALAGGHPDMSLSSRAWLERHTSPRWFKVWVLADRLFGAGHCEGSWDADCRYADDVKRIQNEGLK